MVKLFIFRYWLRHFMTLCQQIYLSVGLQCLTIRFVMFS